MFAVLQLRRESTAPIQALLTSGCILEEARNLKMFSALWKEQGNLCCGTPLFFHENRHLDCWRLQFTIILNSVSTAAKLSRKVISKLI